MQIRALINMNHSASSHGCDRLGNRGKSIQPIDSRLVAGRQKIIVRNGGTVRKPHKRSGDIDLRQRCWSTDQHNVIARAAVVIDAVGTTTPGRDNSSIGEPRKGPDDRINAIILNNDVDVSGQRLSRPEVLKIQRRGGIDRDCARDLRLVVIDSGHGSRISTSVIIIQFNQQC